MYFARNVLAMMIAGVLLLGAAPAPKTSPSASPSPAPPMTGGEMPDSVTHHTDTIDGTSYAYTARAGLITLTNQQGQPTANVFYTADTLDGTDPGSRPVTFI